MDQGARFRGCTGPRRHSSPNCEIDTATFDDHHDTHGSLPMVSENNTSIKKMVSNAENQVVGRCTAGNQALRRASRDPSCTTSTSQKFKLKSTLLHVCRSCERGIHVRCYLLVFSAVVVPLPLLAVCNVESPHARVSNVRLADT